MENNKNTKIIIAGIVIAVVIIATIITLIASCNSGNKNDEGSTTSSSEKDTYGCTEEVATEDIEESIAMGDNEVPFDDAAAEAMSSAENTQETIVYEVTQADGSKVTEADGSIVTTVAYVTDEAMGDNEVSFGDETTASDESDIVEVVSTEVAETLPGNDTEIETDEDGWTTNIVKP